MAVGRARVQRASAPSRSPARRLRSWLFASLFLAAVGALWLALDARFYVSYIAVTGTVQSSGDEILRASGLPGLHALWVHPAEIEARILATLPNVESAHVSCRLLARCTISVVERQPRVTWDETGLPNGQLWWIDAQGVIFSSAPYSPPGPQDGGGAGWWVRGPLPRDEDGRLDARARVALAELWASGADALAALTYVPERGFVFTDERGWRIILGQGPGMDRRLQALEWLVADLEARGITPRFVDVRFADAPYYSLTNDW